MSFLLLEQRQVTYDDIPELELPGLWNVHSIRVIEFCKDWLKGQDDFEIYTSGSTGIPKRIVWSRELVQWSIANTASAFHLEKSMHALLCMDSEKAGGKMMLARALELGMSLEVVPPSLDPFKETISTFFNFAAMVPAQVQTLHAANRISELEKIDTLILGGARLSPGLDDALQSIKTKVYATYGMTETASHIAKQKLNGDGQQDRFHPLDSVHISVNEQGCAVVHTPFHHGMVTHDQIEMYPDGTFIISGRIDLVVNSGGVKVSIEKVEKVLDKALTATKLNFMNCCAYKQSDEKFGEVVIAIFEGQPFSKVEEDVMREELKNHLDKYEMPKRFFFVDKLSYMDSGKVDRKKTAGEL